MWSVLGTLISGFLLIRDFFGYLLPGAVLFACAAFSIDVQRFAQDNFAEVGWLPKSEWVIAVVVVGASYALGQLLASAGYLVLDGLALLHPNKTETDQERNERLKKLTARSLYFRYRYPALFVELDRRDTIAVFRTGLSMALLGAGCLMPDWPLRIGVLFIGVVMVGVSFRARKHVEWYTARTVAAGRRALAANLPPEPHGTPKPKDDKKDG